MHGLNIWRCDDHSQCTNGISKSEWKKYMIERKLKDISFLNLEETMGYLYCVLNYI
jgi:hypothetical protein